MCYVLCIVLYYSRAKEAREHQQRATGFDVSLKTCWCFCKNDFYSRNKKFFKKNFWQRCTQHEWDEVVTISAMNRFSLLISTHKTLNISRSTILKFNYHDLFVLTIKLIYMYSLQWVWVQRWHQTHNIRNMLDSEAYSFRFITSGKYL